jgi:hypothetical protein
MDEEELNWARVTGRVCEKNRPKFSPTTFLSKLTHNSLQWKKETQMFWLLLYLKNYPK